MSALPKIEDSELLIGMIAAPLSWSHWLTARRMLLPAAERGGEDWSAIERELSSEAMQLWAVLTTKGGDPSSEPTAFAVTRIALTRDGQVAEVFLVGGGDHGAWLERLSAAIEDAARGIGCVAMRAWGRAGWKKPLAALGWSQVAVAYEKALS